ncbi:MAG TPA: SprT family zinc-dependent metalloprotease [Candidatus Saccharimonadales bacterium]|jgi:hypothetical protein
MSLLVLAGVTFLSTDMAALTVVDREFGTVACRRLRQAKNVSVRVREDGTLSATLPLRAALHHVTDLIESSREVLRGHVEQQSTKRTILEDGMAIGHSHKLVIHRTTLSRPSRRIGSGRINVGLPSSMSATSDDAQDFMRESVVLALRRESKAYLPRRLRYLADLHGYDYTKIRFAHPRGRWGSCSTSGTISLNIGLMNLPHELIDYVLLHELAHTVEMNHSEDFWRLVEAAVPEYRQRRKMLRTYSPVCYYVSK